MHMRTFVMTQQANHIQFIPVATLRKRRLRIGSKVCHSCRKWQTANRATWTNIRISDTMTSSDSLPLLCLPTDMGLPVPPPADMGLSMPPHRYGVLEPVLEPVRPDGFEMVKLCCWGCCCCCLPTDMGLPMPPHRYGPVYASPQIWRPRTRPRLQFAVITRRMASRS